MIDIFHQSYLECIVIGSRSHRLVVIRAQDMSSSFATSVFEAMTKCSRCLKGIFKKVAQIILENIGEANWLKKEYIH